MSQAPVRHAGAPSLPLPPPPPVGSPRYFALLYTPPSMRNTLATLLALADEISAGAGRGLDPSVAQIRLDWWRQEAERYARGQPQHPWLRALPAHTPAGAALDLQPLVEAAASDLASLSLSALPGTALQGALFRLAATALRAGQHAAAASAALLQLLNELGERAAELERFAAAPATTLAALRQQAAAIESALQPQLTPLLVWIALAARQSQRRARRGGPKGGSGLAALADNMAAWSAARGARRGRFCID